MTRMFKLAGALVGLAAFAAAPATADTSRIPSAFVIGHLHDFVDQKLSPDQTTQLIVIAHQAATASACEGFELDEEKFKGAFAKLAHASEAGMSADEKSYFEKHVMMAYGVAIGGFLADAAANTSAYCDDADEERKSPDFQAVSDYK